MKMTTMKTENGKVEVILEHPMTGDDSIARILIPIKKDNLIKMVERYKSADEFVEEFRPFMNSYYENKPLETILSIAAMDMGISGIVNLLVRSIDLSFTLVETVLNSEENKKIVLSWKEEQEKEHS